MKSHKLSIFILLLISLASLGGVGYLALEMRKMKGGDKPIHINSPYAKSSDVVVPKKADLAGEPMPLKRVDVYEALKKELIVNTYLHSHTIQLLKNSPRVFDIIVPILKEEGVPEDFKYLAVIESQLNPNAVSYAGAAGMWQFLKSTGKEFGLEVNSEVDERYNIEASTRAAARYLKKAYEKYGSWTLAAASYNGGMGRVSSQMKRQNQDNFYDLLFVEETSRYIYRFVALKEIMTNPQNYNFQVDTPYEPEKVKRVQVSGEVKDFAEFAKTHGITYKTLKRFNPWLRSTSLKNRAKKTYTILIPTDPSLYNGK